MELKHFTTASVAQVKC